MKYILFLIFFVSIATADPLINTSVPVVRYRLRPGVQWNLSDPVFQKGIVFKREEKVNQQTFDTLLPPIPMCAHSRIRKLEVGHFTPQSGNLDFVFYSPEDSSQTSQVNSYFGKVIAYYSNTEIDPETYAFQSLAQAYNIICLPTRFHFLNEGGKRFIEYREGKFAWDPEIKIE